MLKNTLRLIILLHLTPTLSMAQNVFPSYSDSATWNVAQLILFPYGNLYTQVYQYEKDTSFCGNIYSKMNCYGNPCGYYRADSIKAYVRSTTNCSDKEYLIYDYSLAVGDTTYIGYRLMWPSSNDTAPVVVNAIDTVNYFGINRKRMKILFNSCSNDFNLVDTMYWVSGIGSTTHPFYSFNCLCSACEVAYTLLCYREDALLLYKDPQFNTCDTTYIGLDEIHDKQIEVKIFPNPFSTLAKINLNPVANDVDSFSFFLYNIFGKEVMQMSSIRQQTEISRKGLPNGIYFYKIVSNENTVDTGKIIIH